MHDKSINFLIRYLDMKQVQGEILNYSITKEYYFAGYEVRLMFGNNLIHRSRFHHLDFLHRQDWIISCYEKVVLPKINNKLYKMFYL